MDPSNSIMKLLEEDEDETMHSGADVEAFTAALNRDIKGETSTSHPSDSDTAAIFQGSNHTSSQSIPKWDNSSHDENAIRESQQDVQNTQQQEPLSSLVDPRQQGSGSDNQQQQSGSSQQKQFQDDFPQQQAEQSNHHKNPGHVQEPDRKLDPDSDSRYQRLHNMSNQQAISTGQAINAMGRSKQVPFALLLPVIEPQLDKDKAMQLQTLYIRLKKNEISKDEFVRHMRNLVGDQMLKMAVYKLQGQAARNSQSGPKQFPLQAQALSSGQQHLQMSSLGSKQFTGSQPFAQLHQKSLISPSDPSRITSSTAQMFTDSNNSTMENNAQSSRDVERQSDSHGMQVSHMSSSSLTTAKQERERNLPIQGLSRQQQQHLHFSQASFPAYGSTGGNFHPNSGPNVSSSSNSLKQQSYDSHMRQAPVHPTMGASQAMNAKQTSFSEPKRAQGGTLSHFTTNSTSLQDSVHWQSSSDKDQSVKQEPLDQANEKQQKSQNPVQVEQGNAIAGSSNDDFFETHSSRMGFSTSTGMVASNSSSMMTQQDPNSSLSSRIQSATSLVGTGVNAKATFKKPSVGQKKPLEALGSSLPLSSKKQKVSGAFSDQSIEQLNDVTAVSGVNLREEEEQLLTGPKEDSRVSEASRRVVQEEEERLILQKIPLKKKLAEILSKSGVKSISNDVERCLSLSVEERMRGLICSLIRLSKQRVDIEKSRHRTVVTSDVRRQIMIMNRQVREEWEKSQADSGKVMNEPDGSNGVDGDKEKDEGRGKSVKANKEDDDKMRTTAANVAARAAVGGDDMLSKWQLMAEQARQKREGGTDASSGFQAGKDVGRKPVSTSAGDAKENQEAERSNSAATATSGGLRKFGRSQAVMPQTRVARSISIKDVIAVLEREPQTSKSALIYRLHEKVRSDAPAE
ncbi:hypothetical protein RJ639_038245 [Escallonia herrerae]|uniref:RST domain-containing protein n=1 Tax=Escallonia herrerae TaxID=1293975 RepID=A0AA89B7X4_9ASTE|nr:hypothetical protein RJ639_038245 [Escallonia herrerae]